MNLLLDTHSLIWFLDGSSKLGARARKYIEDPANQSFVSIASIWEMAIKISLRKLQMTIPFSELTEHTRNNGFELLPVEFEHTLKITTLDFFHRDPFDRMIIAQGISEAMPIVSADENFDAYPIKRIW